MSEILNIPSIATKPELWGVSVKWKWPEGCIWGHRLELQYLFSDGRLEKEFIPWPVSEKLICGLKAGERLQIRLRLIDKNGNCRDWLSGDWIEGVSSTNAGEYLSNICGEICGGTVLNGTYIQPRAFQSAKLGNSIVDTTYSIKVDTDWSCKKNVPGISATVMSTKIKLSDEMREAVADVVNDAIRNALKPGGLLSGR